MKYQLLNTSISSEIPILGEAGEATNDYQVIITLCLKPIDGIAPSFFKDIEVTSNNSQTGFEVDVQRQQEINNYLNLINQ